VWRFDSDAEGWTAGNISDVHNDWGSLVGTTTTSDPSLTSPATYLDCKRCPEARIRMLASAHAMKIPVGGPSSATVPAEATGQLFWSTTEHGISEATSVTFKVELDSKWHEYELDLAANPNWKGLTDRLRFDPVDMAGVEISIDEIKLLRQ
jgi:hypothetical protein